MTIELNQIDFALLSVILVSSIGSLLLSIDRARGTSERFTYDTLCSNLNWHDGIIQTCAPEDSIYEKIHNLLTKNANYSSPKRLRI